MYAETPLQGLDNFMNMHRVSPDALLNRPFRAFLITGEIPFANLKS